VAFHATEPGRGSSRSYDHVFFIPDIGYRTVFILRRVQLICGRIIPGGITYTDADVNNQNLRRNHFRICMRGASRRELLVEKRIRCEVTSGANHIYR
jgi:hypothetical protein